MLSKDELPYISDLSKDGFVPPAKFADQSVGLVKKEFIEAVKNGDLKKVREYIEARGNPNVWDDYGNTALMLSCSDISLEPIFELLINTPGINIHLGNKVGNTALHLAALIGSKNMLDSLRKAGADLNQTNNFGFNPGRYGLVLAHILMASPDFKKEDKNPVLSDALVDYGIDLSIDRFFNHAVSLISRDCQLLLDDQKKEMDELDELSRNFSNEQKKIDVVAKLKETTIQLNAIRDTFCKRYNQKLSLTFSETLKLDINLGTDSYSTAARKEISLIKEDCEVCMGVQALAMGLLSMDVNPGTVPMVKKATEKLNEAMNKYCTKYGELLEHYYRTPRASISPGTDSSSIGAREEKVALVKTSVTITLPRISEKEKTENYDKLFANKSNSYIYKILCKKNVFNHASSKKRLHCRLSEEMCMETMQYLSQKK